MAKRSKKYQEALKLIEADKFYSPKEAIELVKKTNVTKFDSTVEVSFKLGVNPKYADQQVRGAMVLPHGTGKSKTVLVLLKAPKLQKLKQQAQIMLAVKNMSLKFRAAGQISMSA